MTRYDRLRWAEELFADRYYLDAARVLEALIAETAQPGDAERAQPGDAERVDHRLTGAKLLLARAYYHSAQLGRAERTARAVLAEDPTEAYAALLLGRTLERASRPAEAQRAMSLAAALGAPGTTFPTGPDRAATGAETGTERELAA